MKISILQKTLFSLALLALGMTSDLAAQQQQKIPPAQQAKNQTEHLSKVVHLSQEQYQQVYQLKLDLLKERESFRLNRKGNQRAAMQQMKQAEYEHHIAFRQVLTPAQQKLWTQYLNKKQADGGKQ